jgi:hypothetical protein
MVQASKQADGHMAGNTLPQIEDCHRALLDSSSFSVNKGLEYRHCALSFDSPGGFSTPLETGLADERGQLWGRVNWVVD